jgi:hypothetical protein
MVWEYSQIVILKYIMDILKIIKDMGKIIFIFFKKIIQKLLLIYYLVSEFN